MIYVYPFLTISILPLLFYVIDGYYEKKLRKGIYQILGFIFFTILPLLLVRFFGLFFIFSIPVLFTFFVIITNKKTKGNFSKK